MEPSLKKEKKENFTPEGINTTTDNKSDSSKLIEEEELLKKLAGYTIKSPNEFQLKEDPFMNPLPDKYNSKENVTYGNTKNGKCLVDINKLYEISKKMECFRVQQKKLVVTMNHIVNEYNTLNKNFKKIQKEFSNMLKMPNETDETGSQDIEKRLSIYDPSEINENVNKSSKLISLAVEKLSKTLFVNQIPNEIFAQINEKVEKVIVEEGNPIVVTNENGGFIYYLISGEAHVYDFFENKIANIHLDNWFGMFALLGVKRTATVKATLDCKILKLSVDHLLEILKKDDKAFQQFKIHQDNFQKIYNDFINCDKRQSLCRFRNEFLLELAINTLMKIPIFEQFDIKFLYDLAVNMIPEVVPKGKIIISRDDEPDCLYCVLYGSVEVFSYPEEEEEEIKDKEGRSCDSNKVLVHAELSSNSFFGEIGLLLGIRRTSSIRIKEKSLLIKLTKDILETISNKYPNVKIGIHQRTTKCVLALQDNNKTASTPVEQFDVEVNCQNLRKIKLFSDFDNSTLEEIAMGMTRKSYQPNEFIIKCDEKAESMFFLTHGTVEVISQNNKVIDIAKGPNVYFGEVALLEDVPRIASVKATTHCSVFVLTKAVLLSVLKKNSQFEAEIEKTSRERLQAHLMRSILA